LKESPDYVNLWRPNYEARAAGVWVMAAAVSGVVSQFSSMPVTPFLWMAGACGGMALARLPGAIKLMIAQKSLKGSDLEFTKLEELVEVLEGHEDEIWLGKGYFWENRHAQRLFELMKEDISRVVGREALNSERSKNKIGATFIHGVEPKDEDQFQPIKHAEGHTLITGTTGSGKTRLYDLLITQSIYRNETVFIIDPKGDHDLMENAKRACEALGHAEKFVHFHPADPKNSARINFLENFSNVTEIASRIAGLMATESSSDPFTAFGFQSLNSLAQGICVIDQKPTLMSLRRYLESGPEQLVCSALEAYSKSVYGDDVESMTSGYFDKANTVGRKAGAWVRFYREKVCPEHANPDLEGLLSLFEHDKAHFGKMVASLIPILTMLTAGELGPLLSPDTSDHHDLRPIVNSRQIVENGMVCYLGLDSLSNNIVGSAVGSMALADLASVAGHIYNSGQKMNISVYVDEAAEVINDQCIQLLNKGRGAGFKMFIATQTIADFAARLGSKEKATQVMGNINNHITLRVTDTETQTYFTDNLPKTRLRYVMKTQGMSSHSNDPVLYGGNQGERLMEEEADIFSPQWLSMLPNLEYVAKVSGGRLVKGRLPILTA